VGEGDGGRGNEHEKTRAAAAPRKPKNGAVSSPLNTDDIFVSGFLLLLSLPLCGGFVALLGLRAAASLGRGGRKGREGGQAEADAISLEPSLVSFCCDSPPPDARPARAHRALLQFCPWGIILGRVRSGLVEPWARHATT